MKTTTKTLTLLTVCGCVLLPMSIRGQTTGKDIVDTAVAAGNFETLVKAVQAAGLVDTLKGDGPFTVFAPNDDAFAKLPGSTLNDLLKPENKNKLIDILTFHVVPGRVPASQVVSSSYLDALQGTSILVSSNDGQVKLDRATVLKTDINASNGIIHVIDTVLLPKDILETAEVAGQFNTLLQALKTANLEQALTDIEKPITLFAPTDKAFGKLPAGTLRSLLQPANRSQLQDILKYHVVGAKITLNRIQPVTLQEQTVNVETAGIYTVNGINIAVTDIKATDGVIHVIEKVLMPPVKQLGPKEKALEIIELAIDRGVDLFNSGNEAACAAIYEVAIRSLLETEAVNADNRSRMRLEKGLESIKSVHSERDKAWILRYALDDVRGYLLN